eukprot:Polyplicarium_translucidae@DN3080_c0_g1_i3.p3
MPEHVLCVGGAGYIGSHCASHLLDFGYEVSILDNFFNSCPEVVKRLEILAKKSLTLVECDLKNAPDVNAALERLRPDIVIHFAAAKKVSESVEMPLMYYENNLIGTINLLKAMKSAGCKTLVFSSSATVYAPSESAVTEDAALGPSNPYGQTKLMMEQVLTDLYNSDKTWRISILRYFNPIGAHRSGIIGESPDHPLCVMPYIQQVAVKRRPELNVFGNDWPTRDGTGVRDYIDVNDLAAGHLAALKHVASTKDHFEIFNLGTGKGVSVLELVKAFEEVTGVKIPCRFVGRRPGDVASSFCDPGKAERILKWNATIPLSESCKTAWDFQSKNPQGIH